MNNTIKRTSTQMKIELLTESNAGEIGRQVTISKDECGNWIGGGFQWLTAHLRNGNFIKILEQY